MNVLIILFVVLIVIALVAEFEIAIWFILNIIKYIKDEENDHGDRKSSM